MIAIFFNVSVSHKSYIPPSTFPTTVYRQKFLVQMACRPSMTDLSLCHRVLRKSATGDVLATSQHSCVERIRRVLARFTVSD